MMARENSAQAMGEAIGPHLKAVWRFALSLSANPATADDLTQSTALRAMEKATQYRDDGRLQGWLMTICRSIWLNEVRSRQVRKAGGLDSSEALALADGKPEAETNIFASEVFTQVMGLPEAQRSVVELVYVQELTYSEAATVLDVPIGTVMSRLFAARKKLKQFRDGDAEAATKKRGSR